MKKLVAVALLLCSLFASESQGAVSLWVHRTGDNAPTEYAGTTTGIASALTYIGSTGGEIRIGAGTIVVDGFTGVDKLTITGTGTGTTILQLKNSGNDNVFDFASKNDIHIRDLTIDGNKANNITNAACLRFTQCTRVRVTNVYVHDAEQDGVYISGSTDVKLVGVTSENNGRNGFSCGDANGASNHVKFIGCKSVSNDDTGSAIGFALEPAAYSAVIGCESVGDNRGVTILGGGSTGADYNVVTGCEIIDFTVSGVVLGPGTAGAQQNIISSNVLRPAGDATSGISMSGTNDTTIKGNRIYAFDGTDSNTGIFADTNPTRFSIEGNTIDATGDYGINIGGGTHGVVSNNTVRNASTRESNVRDGIRLSNSLHNVVNGNYVYDDRGTPKMKYGIQSTGTSDSLSVVGNRVHRPATGKVTLAGSTNVNVGNN